MTPSTTIACPLLAAGFDWLEALLPFLFVAFWLISQVFAVFRRVQGGGQRPQPPVRIDRPRGGPRPAGDAGDVRSELERQIEEFLKQARGEQAGRPDGSAAAGQRRPDQPQRGQPRPQPVAKPPQAAGDKKPDAKQTQANKTAVNRAGRRPAPAATTTTSQAAPAQGGSVERHVQDAFSHDLAHSRGGLAHDSTVPETVTPRTNGLAAELTEMLRSPASTRRAILLGEVLDRPVDRW